ncbi:PspA/IM30 family protein [Jannaschia donghaensis]|uniref:PspA/IM30 family protein n=2 Tax=Jannaschia donghaensis TaxID=420998 RepID=A0A0M6YH14_9RHOB|nr:PspA/IM30 family protein [Jannaschia donghaensis]
MLKTLSTLLRGAAATQEEALRDKHAIALIDQKIREADGQMKAAKGTLATMVQRERSERRQLDQVEARCCDLLTRARDAMNGGRDDLANEAAEAVAQLENEARVRRDALSRVEVRVSRLRRTIEQTHRRLIDLRQGAMAARSIRREQLMQSRLRTTLGTDAAIDEAEALIADVLRRDDPGEQADILRETEGELSYDTLPDRMADAGFGKRGKTTGADVLARLKTNDIPSEKD